MGQELSMRWVERGIRMNLVGQISQCFWPTDVLAGMVPQERLELGRPVG
jgi:hypothetical protein